MNDLQEDISAVVSTVFFISGVTTLLHTFFGTRLPLIQGPSFVYLAPALAIINSPDFQGLNENVCFSMCTQEHKLLFLIHNVKLNSCLMQWMQYYCQRD